MTACLGPRLLTRGFLGTRQDYYSSYHVDRCIIERLLLCDSANEKRGLKKQKKPLLACK